MPVAFPWLRCALATAVLCAANASAQGEPDALLNLPVSQQNIVEGLQADAYANGLNAYVWGYPLVRMERAMRDYTQVPEPKPATSYRAPLNQIGWATALATPSAKDMPTANNDTLYMSAVVELDEPYVLHVPDTADRYYVVNLFSMWQELEHYIGRRATGTQAGDYVLVPPGWTGQLPSGLIPLRVSTRKVWLWGRLAVEQGENLAPLHALQQQFSLRPLSQRDNPNYTPPVRSLAPLPAMGDDGLGFYRQLAAALKDNPVAPKDEGLFAQFRRFGLSAQGFDPSRLAPPQKEGLRRALEDGPKVAVSAVATAAVQRNGWTWATGLDNFGSNYPLRALVAGPYLGGQGEQEALYPMRSTDAQGQQLSGARQYVIRFKGAPPVDAFWSLTAYNAQDKMLVENPIARYKLGSDTPGLKVNGDGSFTVTLQARQTDADNWLPTPEGPFYLILRLYQPRAAVLDGHYELPQVEVMQ
ncbi:DUF1254 domain-containing protein [Pseudomonas fontis]|uniref:DUF1214 domain-containing protein n=1 Tax=Pseudomonas fontis TaxID=2942633 RepID=A0ABT5NXX5_9PSED|nr:DUF1254 domain-containing protein [Pseudomonas fontis]MDD0972499.1 DUF1214 domain-containing protein [Pseudomonas fontis]MDD0993023.1 DUF1214 domain-containing protein [Pseudomonas fontis]